jgi:1-acyl-sn-glycerol-3-phosphate acyltransferase
MLGRLRAKSPSGSAGKSLLYSCCRRIATGLSWMFLGYTKFDQDRVPVSGACLIAANHQSFLDPPLIGGAVLGRHLAFVARAGLFRFFPMRWLLTSINALPIREDRGDAGAIKTVLELLGHGHGVVIFPEGSRTPDGAMHEFKRGIALLVKRSGCPVVPAAIEGAYDAWPIHRRFPRMLSCPVYVAYGHPIPHEELLKDGADAALLRLAREIDALRVKLREEMRKRTGGKYPAPGAGDRATAWVRG